MNNFSAIDDILQNKNFVMFSCCIAFMLGILTFFAIHPIILALIYTCILIITLSLRIFTIRKIIIFALIFYFGFLITFLKVKTCDSLVTLAPINSTISGRVVSIPNTTSSDKLRFFFEVEKVKDINVSGKTLVTMPYDKNKILNIGDKIEVDGNLRIPFKSTNPSQFDYSSYLKNFNVFTVLYVNDTNYKIIPTNSSLKWKFLKKLNVIRNDVLKTHSKYLKSPNIEILGGIVFGDDAVAPPEYIKKSFINSGLLHILAASGMNVAFIFSFWFIILKFLKIPYRPRVISGMLVIILYTLMTGLGASVIRAALMLIFVLAGKLIDRDAHSISLLAFVAVLMLIYNPAYINDVSFQLSFLVTFGLLTTSHILSQKLPQIPDYLKIPIIIPFVAQIWVAPIQMFYFNTISLYSILANILSATILSIISFLGFISSILAIVKPVANFVCCIVDFILNYLLTALVWISNFFGHLPHCIIQTTHPNIFQIIIYYIMLICATYLIKIEKYRKAIFTIIIVLAILLLTNIKFESKDLTITAFDVRNADCFLIKTPQNKYFFIDTGKAPYQNGNSQAKIIMLKYLMDRGIKNIKGLIVTHFDSDHSGGVIDIIKNTDVENLYLNSRKTSTQTAKNIFKIAKEINQKIIIPDDDTIIYKEPNLTIKTFKANITKNTEESNESSIITLLSYKNFDMLFMGDAGIVAYEKIKNELPENIEILKVGHHGGADTVNEEMLNKLGIKTSLISTGINHFGHPNKGTLDVLRNTCILRTDFLHSIKITTKGNNYKVFSYNPRIKKYTLREIFNSK